MDKLIVRITKNYGETIVYPVCEKSKLFAEIAGTKTLTENTRLCITKLGYSFKIQQEVLDNG